MIGATAHSHLYQAQYRGESRELTHNCASDQAGTLIDYRTLHPLKSQRHRSSSSGGGGEWPVAGGDIKSTEYRDRLSPWKFAQQLT